MKDKIVDILALIVGLAFIAFFCAGLGLLGYFKVVERPKDVRPGPAEGVSVRQESKRSGRVPPGIAIDIRPDGGGLEGDLDSTALAKVIGK